MKTSGSSNAEVAASTSTKVKTPRSAGAVRSRAPKVAAAGKAAAGRAATAKRASTAKAQAKSESDKVAEKQKKLKLVRDSFTMPGAEYAEIAAMKKRFLAHGVAVKKSEILRAAIHTLAALKDPALLKAIEQLAPIKAGRPLKEKK